METTPKAIAIAGLNASGKTQFVEQMRRRMATDSLRYIAFCDSYGAATDRSYYLQQRWNQHDIDEETPRVGQALERSFLMTGPDTPERRRQQQELYRLLGVDPLLQEYVIALSSGELRKFQLVKTLLAGPKVLILDNPFIGLDADARQLLGRLLATLVSEQGITLYMVLAKESDIPPFTEHIIRTTAEQAFTAPPRRHRFTEWPAVTSSVSFMNIPDDKEIITIYDISIRYGERTIISHFSWTIKEGECWALSGPNGSGKSTLLSLICADNPQAYACDITLFGHRRGSGESIWDIKRNIGYVSPEMHRSYQRSLPALHVVASGLKDTIGLYVRPNSAEREQCLWWMRQLEIDELADRPFLQLSSGEQRMVLVARAFVKDPRLLILDEPLHGLDLQRQQLVRDLTDAFCARPGKTLIMVTHYEEELPACITRHMTMGKKTTG